MPHHVNIWVSTTVINLDREYWIRLIFITEYYSERNRKNPFRIIFNNKYTE